MTTKIQITKTKEENPPWKTGENIPSHNPKTKVEKWPAKQNAIWTWGRNIRAIQLLLLFILSVVSNSSRPLGLQHARPPSPSLSARVCPSSCSLCWRCCPAILVHPLMPSSPSSLSFSSIRGFSNEKSKTKILELQHQTFQWIFRVDLD